MYEAEIPSLSLWLLFSLMMNSRGRPVVGIGISFANIIEKTKEKKFQKREEKEKAIIEWEEKIKKISAMNILNIFSNI